MSRIDPEHARTHHEDRHHLLDRGSLAYHIAEHHLPQGVTPSEVLADWYRPDDVAEHLRTHGIPPTDEPIGEGSDYMEPWEADGLLVWHERAHDILGFRV